MIGIAVTTTDLLVLLTVLLTTLGVGVLLVATQRWHGNLSLDHDLNGVQKIHKRPVPRVGGLAVAAGLVAGTIVAEQHQYAHADALLALLLCAIPAFGAGLLEDLTKRVSVRARLIASFVSGLAAVWLLDASLAKLDTPGLDWLMMSAPLAALFTCFAVGGVTNAVNIVDGVNGLASGSVTIMLGGLGVMAGLEGDQLVLSLCLAGIAALLGFMALNYPFGFIFMGDGGAYLSGFWLAECAVLLLARNPEVSTWAVLLCCLYPVWETLFSMYRRQFVGRVKTGDPDSGHLHHLILDHVTHGQIRTSPDWITHGITSSSLWMLTLMCQVLALSAYAYTPMMAPLVGMFCLVYTTIYGTLSGSSPRQLTDERTS